MNLGNTINGVSSANSTTNMLVYLHTDHLGSVYLVTNESGQEIGRQQYDAWGKVRSGGNVTQTKLNYTGQRKDDTGLHYYHARYYDSGVGRFNSPDSIVPGGFHKPQSLGRFSYVLNNPVVRIDPTGHKASEPEFGIPEDPATGIGPILAPGFGSCFPQCDLTKTFANVQVPQSSASIGGSYILGNIFDHEPGFVPYCETENKTRQIGPVLHLRYDTACYYSEAIRVPEVMMFIVTGYSIRSSMDKGQHWTPLLENLDECWFCSSMTVSSDPDDPYVMSPGEWVIVLFAGGTMPSRSRIGELGFVAIGISTMATTYRYDYIGGP